MKLQGKVALITGGASGNGKAIAELFAREGAKAAIVDINAIAASELSDSLNGQGYITTSISADITIEEHIRRMIDETISTFGRLDILINNAGIFDMLAPISDVTDSLWEKVMNINLTAPMRAIRYTLPLFKKQGGGIIVNTASIAGLTGARGGGAAYVASKHGLIGLTKHVAFCYKEWNIRCNAVAPGRVETNLRENSKTMLTSKETDTLKSETDMILKKITDGYITNMRKANPDEIAKVVLFLASEDSSFVNGSVFVADGAWTSY